MFNLFLGLVFVVRVLDEVELSQSFGFLHVRVFFVSRHLFPSFAKVSGDYGIVHIGLVLIDFLSFIVGEDHKGVHGAFYFLGIMGNICGI